MYIFERTLLARNEQHLSFTSLGQAISANKVSLKVRDIPYTSGTYQWYIKTSKTAPDNTAIAGESGSLANTGIITINFNLTQGVFTIGSTYYLALRVFDGSGISQEVIQISFSISQNAVSTEGSNILNVAPIYLPDFTTAQRNALSVGDRSLLIYNTSNDQIEQYDPVSDVWGPFGGATVASVNGQTGVVVLNQDNIADGTTYKQYSATEKTKLASITAIFTTALKTAYDTASTWVTTNGTNVLNHLANSSNPHSVTKAQIGLANVQNLDQANPANISQTASYRFVTDSEKSTWNGKQNALGFTPENSANKGQANGYASLGADSKIPTSQLPALAITDTFVVASQAAMLALTAEIGDVAVRSDQNKSYILRGADPTLLANWQELLTPTDSVLSVNGQTGSVTLTTTNVAEGSNLYFTTARVLNTLLTGLSLATNSVISATDSVLTGLGKLQAQITNQDSIKLNKTGDSVTDFLGFPLQGSTPASPANGFRMFADASGRLSWENSSGLVRTINAQNNTQNRIYDLQDYSGELQLRSGPNYADFFTDFIGSGDFLALANNGAAGAATNLGTVVGSGNRPGIVQLVTGTTTTGRANYRALGTSIVFGTAVYIFETDIQVPTLSDGTNRFLAISGFSDFDGGEPTDGVYFVYSDNINGGKWSCKTRNNSVETAVDSGITVNATQWYRLRVAINSAGTSTVFSIDGSVVATITTNIPTGDTRATGIQGTVVKTLGTTARTVLYDWARLQYFIPSTR